MATLSGTATGAHLFNFDKDTGVQHALVTFTLSGTYAQADDAQLQNVGAFITSARRNGKTATLIDAMRGVPASKQSDETAIMSLKTVAVSSDDVTFEVTDTDESTELANGAVPAQGARPFSIVVSFTEA